MYLCRATFFGLLELSTNMESSSLFRKTKDLNGLHKAEGYNLCVVLQWYTALRLKKWKMSTEPSSWSQKSPSQSKTVNHAVNSKQLIAMALRFHLTTWKTCITIRTSLPVPIRFLSSNGSLFPHIFCSDFIPTSTFTLPGFHTLHSTLHTLHSTLYTLQPSLHTPHSTLYTLDFTLYALHSKPQTLHFTHSTWHFTLFPLHTILYNLYTLHVTLHTPYCTPHTLHFALYTLHSTLYTLRFTHYTLHSTLTLHTLHFKLYTWHSTLPHLTPFTLRAPLLPNSYLKEPHSTLPAHAPKSPPKPPSWPSNFPPIVHPAPKLQSVPFVFSFHSLSSSITLSTFFHCSVLLWLHFCILLPSIPLTPNARQRTDQGGIEPHRHPIATWYMSRKIDHGGHPN